MKCSCGNELRSPSGSGGLVNVACSECGVFYGDEGALTPELTQTLLGLQFAAARRAMRIQPPVALLFWLCVNLCIVVFRPSFFRTLGLGSTPSLPVQMIWLFCFNLILVFTNKFCWSSAIIRFQDHTGYTYVRDRAAVARAGAYDGALVAPILSGATIFGILWCISVSVIRDGPAWSMIVPWLTLVVFPFASQLGMVLLTTAVFRFTCAGLPPQQNIAVLML